MGKRKSLKSYDIGFRLFLTQVIQDVFQKRQLQIM
ncbi:MAG: hypothetical protein H6Q70_648 [Firmicutes bacterium]|nr:hypothetical protein [Bacillota bacterium]